MSFADHIPSANNWLKLLYILECGMKNIYLDPRIVPLQTFAPLDT